MESPDHFEVMKRLMPL